MSTHTLWSGRPIAYRSGISPRFASGELEAAFRREDAAASLRSNRVALLLALAIYAGVGALDPWIAGPATPAVWMIRGVVCVGLFVTFAATHTAAVRGYIQPLLAASVLLMGLGWSAMVLVSAESTERYYYIGILLVLIYAYALLRLRFGFAAGSAWLVTAGYTIVVLGLEGHTLISVFNDVIFLVAANTLGMFAVQAREKYAHDAFIEGERLRILIEAMNEGLVTVDSTGRITWVNRSICDIMGYSIEELIDHHAAEFLDEENREIFAEQFTARKQGDSGRYEIEWLRKDGESVPTMVSPHAFFDEDDAFAGSVAVVSDISALKEAEQALQRSEAHIRRSERHFRELVDYASSIILRWDTDGTIRFVNPYGLRLLGYTEEEIRGRSVIGTIVQETESTGRNLVDMINDIGLHPERYLYNENEICDRQGRRYWVVWTNRGLTDASGRVSELLSIGTDITELKKVREELGRQRDELAELNEFIRRIFGRYVSDAVVQNLLESPEGLEVGGKTACVTILVADIRGFSIISEELSPEQVVSLINTYLESMTEIIERYDGTIDEFIGDAILVIFGAPGEMVDHAERAVACALAMQLGIGEVNARTRERGLPAIEMGIGVHTGEVVVGNIGSKRRAKYGVVGANVNLATRIETYTVGGQILISEATRRAVGPILRLGRHIDVEPKGVRDPIAVHEVQGIGGRFEITLAPVRSGLGVVPFDLGCRYFVLEEKFVQRTAYHGRVVRLSTAEAEVMCDTPPSILANLKLLLIDEAGRRLGSEVYAKVVELSREAPGQVTMRFTSVSSATKRRIEEILATEGVAAGR